MFAKHHGIIALSLTISQCFSGATALGQERPMWVDPPNEFSRPDALDSPGSIPTQQTAASSVGPDRRAPRTNLTNRRQAAVDFAAAYLSEWSSPNRVTLASTSSYYGPKLVFHGRERSIQSVFAEKRRFAERWPERSYQHRPELTQVACDDDQDLCTVWSIFDYSAADGRGRQSRGLGEHELVISFVAHRPLIVAETSRVLRRGAVPGR